MIDKPPYRVPSMMEVRAGEPNGFRVVSTFAGCGGSSLGYRMAGFKVALANEFVDVAAACYEANMDPSTVLWYGDVRSLKPSRILEETGLRVGELDLFDGSPPCASFSTAGKRLEGWDTVRKYSESPRTSNNPRMEQRVDDLFDEYFRLLIGLAPKVFVAENVSGLVKGGAAQGIYTRMMRAFRNAGYVVEARLIDAQWCGVPQQRVRVIFQGVRDDLRGADGRQLRPAWPKPLPYRYSVRDALPWVFEVGTHERERSGDRPAPTVQTHGRSRTESELTLIEADSDMTGLSTGAEWDKLAEGAQSEKYFQLVRADRNLPSPTVTASGGNAGLASVAHPTERRKFSIAELKRICSFPDDFVLKGTYAQQWERLGRAVPPLMMRAVAEAIRDGVLRKVR